MRGKNWTHFIFARTNIMFLSDLNVQNIPLDKEFPGTLAAQYPNNSAESIGLGVG